MCNQLLRKQLKKSLVCQYSTELSKQNVGKSQQTNARHVDCAQTRHVLRSGEERRRVERRGADNVAANGV